MRIHRLDLLRYGRFTEVSLELPIYDPDLHIVFGPNEAGKSTALLAIEDFLFGIPHNSTLNFLHNYGSMRIGAVLQQKGETLEVRRRKGNRDTLLTPEEIPIQAGDGALAPFLGGADRSFFARMFSLDHERLRQGGREILEARDEIGQMLFSAGAGIANLRGRLNTLEEEADLLWSSRRAAHRKYYQAEDRLKEAEKLLRDHIVTADSWQKLRNAHEAAQEAYNALEQEVESKSAELRKLSRLRRVYRDVQRKHELDAHIKELGEVTPFPEDARRTLEKAERDDAKAKSRIEALTEQLEAAQKERAALTYDEALLLRTEDIKQLHERRIQVRNGKADLPKRRAELAHAEADLRRLASELEWEAIDIDQLMLRLPARSKLTSVRTLMNRHGELLSGTKITKAALEEVEARLAEVKQKLADLGTPIDVSKLAAIIKAIRESGDITSQIKTAEGETQNIQAAIQRRLRSLKPEVSDETELTAMSVPTRDTVQSHRDARRDLDQRLHDCREHLHTTEDELDRHRKACERIARDENVMPPEDLARVRKHRDFGWSLIRQRYVDGISLTEKDLSPFLLSGDNLPDAYEDAVREADEASDQRFDKAEAGARLAEISRQIADKEDVLEALRREENTLCEENQALEANWESIWAEVPFSPSTHDAMLEWIATRTEVLDLVERQDIARREVASLFQEEVETKTRLLAELDSLGIDSVSLKDQPLRVILEAAADVQHGHEKTRETRQVLTEELRKATAETERKRKAVDKATVALSEWENQWTDVLSALGLGETASPDAVAVQVNAIDEMREFAVKVNELRHERIGKIERNIADFRSDVAKIARSVAADLLEKESEDAVLELERRLNDAQQIQKLQQAKDEETASLEMKIEECDNSRSDAREILRHFQETAGVENIDEIKHAIDMSDKLRDLQSEHSRVMKTLTEEGDGLSVVELQEECKAVDLDQMAAREYALAQELEEIRERQMEARENRTSARQGFEAIGGDDAAARAAADKEAALAEMKEIAEQYVRVRSASLLLQWAIERYRREKQAPLLKRAGHIFATLTSGSFSDLRLEFDEQDNAYLIGLRPDDSKVGMSGMSTSTADQFYLSLRIASVEDYLERASPLPFVADDLFINFDDERAASGFEVLGQLAQRTQVLFFTHHQHLVDIARTTLGTSVSVISLL